MCALRVLITGSGGFTGRHTVEEALRHQAEVFGLSRSGNASAGVRPIAADLNDAGAVGEALRETRPDAVIHLAANTPANSPGLSPQDWVCSSSVATVNLFEAVQAHAPEARVLLVSSSAVYGHVTVDEMPIVEERALRPTTMYGVSKATQELVAARYASELGLHIVCARSFNLLGPGEPRGMLTSTLAAQVAAIAAGQAPAVIRMRHRATQRDFTDVRDAVRAYWDVLSAGTTGQIYNVCSGRATSIGAVLDRLLVLAGVSATIEETAGKPGTNDILIQRGSPAKLEQLTGWRPQIELDTSLADILQTFLGPERNN